MVLYISKQKALKAITQLRSRIPVLKTKEEGSLDYQLWKDEANDVIKLIFGENTSFYANFHEELNPSFFGGSSFDRYDHVDYKAIFQRRLNALDSKLNSLLKVID